MKQTTKDLIKALLIITLAFATGILIIYALGTDQTFVLELSLLLGIYTYLQANKWLNDERDRKSGITKAADDELRYMQ